MCGQHIRAWLKRRALFNKRLGLQRLKSVANLPGREEEREGEREIEIERERERLIESNVDHALDSYKTPLKRKKYFLCLLTERKTEKKDRKIAKDRDSKREREINREMLICIMTWIQTKLP